jgi:hypothetical protein
MEGSADGDTAMNTNTYRAVSSCLEQVSRFISLTVTLTSEIPVAWLTFKKLPGKQPISNQSAIKPASFTKSTRLATLDRSPVLPDVAGNVTSNFITDINQGDRHERRVGNH